MTSRAILQDLRTRGRQRNIDGMARFGITTHKAFGVSTPAVKALARKIGRNHALALELWKAEYLEARALAALIADANQVTRALMNTWVNDFDNWAICDTVCGNLFDRTAYAEAMALKWSKNKKEFIRRAGFVMMAEMAVHRKELPDLVFVKFLSALPQGALDERNSVKKAVNWALRQIGKRNGVLHQQALVKAREIRKLDSRAAKWIASDALRELTSQKILHRLRRKSQ